MHRCSQSVVCCELIIIPKMSFIPYTTYHITCVHVLGDVHFKKSLFSIVVYFLYKIVQDTQYEIKWFALNIAIYENNHYNLFIYANQYYCMKIIHGLKFLAIFPIFSVQFKTKKRFFLLNT